MAGAGFLDAHADEVYRLELDDLYLTGTSEVALAGYHADEILDLSGGPLRYAGWSACYRREAGSTARTPRASSACTSSTRSRCSAGAGSRTRPRSTSDCSPSRSEMLAKVEVPYRVIDIAAGDLGGPAARKYDCEAWVPTQGRYRELTSTCNCTTYQARRLGVRERDPQREGPEPGRSDAQRHAGHDPVDRRHPGEPPAGRRLGRGTEGLAARSSGSTSRPVDASWLHDEPSGRARRRRHDGRPRRRCHPTASVHAGQAVAALRAARRRGHRPRAARRAAGDGAARVDRRATWSAATAPSRCG